MTKKANGVGFWNSAFPNQLGNLCFIAFWIGLVLLILHAGFDLNVFDPNCFKSTDARIPDLGTRRVVDEAGVLTSGEIDALTRRIDAFEAASGGQMAVLLIRPGVPNYGRPGHGPKLVEGMTICIEPMVLAGGRSVYLDRNGWSVHSADRSLTAHYELTVVVRRGRAEQLSTFEFIENDPKIRF